MKSNKYEFEYEKEMKLTVYKIKEWVSDDNINIHLFVGTIGKSFVKLFEKIQAGKESSLTSDQRHSLMNMYCNYDFLKKTLEKDTKKYSLNLIYKSIHPSDTINILKNKLGVYITPNVNSNHIYMWNRKKINIYEYLDILNQIYRDSKEIKQSIIVDLFSNIFDQDLDIKHSELFRKEEIYLHDLYMNSKDDIEAGNIYSHFSLEFVHVNHQNEIRAIRSNPFKETHVYHDFINLDGTISYEKYKVHSPKTKEFDIVKNHVNDFVINYTTSKYLEVYTREYLREDENFEETSKIDQENILFNGAIQPFFPNIVKSDFTSADISRVSKMDIQRVTDQDDVIDTLINSIQSSVNQERFRKVFGSLESNLYYLRVYVTPLLINHSHYHLLEETRKITRVKSKKGDNITNVKFISEVSLNMEGLFNNFETSNKIPFVQYYDSDTNVKFKINKNALTILNPDNQGISIGETDLNLWTNRMTIPSKNKYISFRHYLHSYGSTIKFYEIRLEHTGDFTVIYNMSQEQSLPISRIIDTFEDVNKLIDNINHELQIELLPLHINMIENDFTYVNTPIQTINQITYYDSILSPKDLTKVFSYLYPFIDINLPGLDRLEYYESKEITPSRSSSAIITGDTNYFKFKRINNYFTDDLINSTIFRNDLINEPIEVVVNHIMSIPKLNLTKTQVTKIYNDRIQMLRYIGDNNQYIMNSRQLIKFTIKSKVLVEYNTEKIINFDTNLRINTLLLLILNNHELSNITNKMNQIEINKKRSQFDDIFTSVMGNIAEKSQDVDQLLLKNDNNDNDNDNDDEFIEGFEGIDFDVNSLMNDDLEIESPTNVITKSNTFVNTDVILGENIKDELDDLDDTEYNKLTKGYILNKLQKADPDLFTKNIKIYNKKFKTYSEMCQPISRHPIVLTHEQKKIIDEKYPGSYKNFVKTGSTKEHVRKYFYICPSYWCPLSHISMTDEQFKSSDGKCPKDGEEIIDRTTIDYGIPNYAKLDKPIKHPDNKQSVCCGKRIIGNQITTVFGDEFHDEIKNEYDKNSGDIKLDKKSTKNKKDASKISRHYVQKNNNKPGELESMIELPERLNLMLNNQLKCNDYLKSASKCFVRKGMSGGQWINQTFLSTIIYLMNNPDMVTVDDFIRLVDKNLTPLEYIELNNGNTMKIYYNHHESENIYDPKNYLKFRKWFLSDISTVKDYIRQMNLEALVTFFTKIKKDTNIRFVYEPEHSKLHNIILREYMVYNSFHNFKTYLQVNELIKSHDDILQLFENKLPWLNPKGINIILMEYVYNPRTSQNPTKDEVDNEHQVNLLCSKYTDYNTRITSLNPFGMILKISDNVYEPLVFVELINNEIAEKNNFNYLKDTNIKRLVDNYSKNCNRVFSKQSTQLIDPIKLYEEISEIRTPDESLLQVESLVINMSFKLVGFMTTVSGPSVTTKKPTHLYIPLNSVHNSTNIFRGKYMEDKVYNSLIYVQDIVDSKYKCHLSWYQIQNIYKILSELMETDFYDLSHPNIRKIENNKELIKNNQLVAIIMSDLETVIPVNVSSSYYNIIQENIDDELIFLGLQKQDEVHEFIKDYMEHDNDYHNKLKLVIFQIMKDAKIIHNIKDLKNPYNPYTKKIKLAKIQRIIENMVEKLDKLTSSSVSLINKKITSEEILQMVSDIYIKDFNFIEKQSDTQVKLKDFEVYITKKDIIGNPGESQLDKLVTMLRNPFKKIEDSIEGYIHYKEFEIAKNMPRIDFLSHKEHKIISVLNDIDLGKDINGDKLGWGDLLLNLSVNQPPNKYEYNMKDYLLRIFKELMRLNGNARKVSILTRYIKLQREADFTLDKYRFMEDNKRNSFFLHRYKQYIPLKLELKGTFEYKDISPLFDLDSYQYSYYEIRKLAEFVGINLIIIGSEYKNKLTNGIQCYQFGKKNDNFVLFNIDHDKSIVHTTETNRKEDIGVFDQYRLIIRQQHTQFIFNREEFSRDFVKKGIDKFCTKVIRNIPIPTK
jgi:hypothetical protein